MAYMAKTIWKIKNIAINKGEKGTGRKENYSVDQPGKHNDLSKNYSNKFAQKSKREDENKFYNEKCVHRTTDDPLCKLKMNYTNKINYL